MSGLSLHWEQQALCIRESFDGDIIAALSYRKLLDRSCYWICMAYVVPAYRKKGLYRDLIMDLCRRASEDGAATVEGEILTGNTASLEAAKALGFQRRSARYAIDVEATAQKEPVPLL